ncbi:hypothetical protein RDI58_028430 [Solanum bulbocastanum]|uniref:O-fucosyltransferase family protein n=1 Tax=Solanum bulbocastanum TaxID=147425 RepID=A0AAN8SUZ9_SOLBU
MWKRKLVIFRKLLNYVFAVNVIAFVTLLCMHVHVPSTDITINLCKNWTVEDLWKSSPNKDYVHCVAPSSLYTSPPESRGNLLVHANGGFNQMRAGICDMVAVARIINATLVIPELDKGSLWKDSRSCVVVLAINPSDLQLLVDRMRHYGPYIALHLRYEKDMLAFSGCTHDLSPKEADELRAIRESIPWWKVKDINPVVQRAKGNCPSTPREARLFLSALGFTSNTQIYIAAGEIYGGDSHMYDPQWRKDRIEIGKDLLQESSQMDRFRSEEAFYVNSLPDCLCQRELSYTNDSHAIV